MDSKSSNCPISFKISIKESILLILFFIVGILLKYYLWYDETNGGLGAVRYDDEIKYYINGARLLLEQGLSYFQSPRSFYNPPFNIFFLALLNNDLILARFLNIVLVTIICGGSLWLITKKICGTCYAFWGLALFILYYPINHHSATVLSEPLFINFLMLSFLCISLFNKSKLGVVFSGIFLAFATFTRPATFLFPLFFVFIAILFYIFKKNNYNSRSLLRTAFLFFPAFF